MKGEKTILLLPAYFTPEQMASTHLDNDRYLAFAQEGFKMLLCTPSPTRGIDSNSRKLYKKRKKEVMYDGMMNVVRFSLFDENNNTLLRAFRYVISFIQQLCYGIVNSKNVDVVFLVSTPPIQGLIGAFLKKFKKVPFIYNLQDIFPDSLVSTGLAKKGGMLWKIGRYVERLTYKYADKIIVVSDDFKENLILKGVPENKIRVIYNWVDENEIVPISKQNNTLYDEFKIRRDYFNIVYAGNFGNAQDIDTLISAASELQSIENITFCFWGSGGLVEKYKSEVLKKQLSNVRFFPLQPKNRVSEVYSLGDACIVSCKKGIGKNAFPSKTWSIMSTGTPIIANYDKATCLEKILKNSESGLLSDAGDVKQLVDNILFLYNSPDICKRYGYNARTFVEKNVCKKNSTKEYIDVIKSLTT